MAQHEVLSVRQSKPRFLVEGMIAGAGSCFLALMSQLAVPLIGTPVPMTLQTLGVFLLGGILGSRRAVYSVIGYLVQGCLGLPVFAGGVSNPLWIVSPQAGFLLSFVIGAYLIGRVIERKPKADVLYVAGALILGQMVIFGLGMMGLSFYVGISKSFFVGVVPFLSGAALKIIIGSLLLRVYRGCVQK